MNFAIFKIKPCIYRMASSYILQTEKAQKIIVA